MTGVSLFAHANEFPAAAKQLGEWVKSGRIEAAENVLSGFNQAPEILSSIFTGKPPGKLVLNIVEAEEA
jgi:NADPH-dependent curcumin reductase CurA